MDTIEKIKDVLDMIRPYLINEGGDIEFIKYEDKTVYIKMNGACADCQFSDYTMKEVIEQSIKEEVDEVEHVVNLNEQL